MDKILFIGQNPKDFTCEEHYSSLKRIFKHGINLLGLLLLFFVRQYYLRSCTSDKTVSE